VGRQEICTTLWLVNLKQRDHSEDLGTDGDNTEMGLMKTCLEGAHVIYPRNKTLKYTSISQETPYFALT
jgi:hypothetical protein